MSKVRPTVLLLGLLLIGVPLAAYVAAETYTMKEGDTLWDIARVKYGDPSFYTDLQRANNISDPRNIATGTVITLYSKETLTKLRGVTDPAERARILKEDPASGGSTDTAGTDPAGPQEFKPVDGLMSRKEVPSTGGAPPTQPTTPAP